MVWEDLKPPADRHTPNPHRSIHPHDNWRESVALAAKRCKDISDALGLFHNYSELPNT